MAGAEPTLTGEPGGLTTLVRAALPAVPGVNRLPGIRKGPARELHRPRLRPRRP